MKVSIDRKDLETMRRVGGQMSSLCYNLSKQEWTSETWVWDRETLAQLAKEWDAISVVVRGQIKVESDAKSLRRRADDVYKHCNTLGDLEQAAGVKDHAKFVRGKSMHRVFVELHQLILERLRVSVNDDEVAVVLGGGG